MMKLEDIAVRQIKGVTALKEQELHAFGVHNVADLLNYFPFRYEDYRVQGLAEAKDGDKLTVEGTVMTVPAVQHYGKGKSRLTCKVAVDQVIVTAVWFNRPYLREQLIVGRAVTLTGKWESRRLQITVAESQFPDKGTTNSDTVQPVYSVGGSLTQAWMRKTMVQALEQFGSLVEEILPLTVIEQYRFLSRREAIQGIHHPRDLAHGQAARRRLVYEEFFIFQLKLQAYRAFTRTRIEGIAHLVDARAIREFAQTFPFELTDAQKKVVNEIFKDMRATSSMNRLLQGDVGSGKTIVAAIALFASVKAGYQGALMVPTEILAEQHYRSLKTLFAPQQIEVGLLTGSMTERKRREVLTGIEDGSIHIVIGTHALIQSGVFFAKLGLVVTDEQHRFGVNQRSVLRRKGYNPDVLTMTATPIPRTLAITAFGDMDVSTIKERPKGRKPIRTRWVKHNMLDQVLAFIQREVDLGRQAYFICPLIEESEKLDVQNAIDLHAQLQQHFPLLQVGLLHGRLAPSEKEAVMAAFAANQTQVLVATTVVEVGVDVPNATLMIIIDAERFGLSQLHQLRGRVGRGEHQSYCVLIADPKSETGRERMKVMTETDDGFEVARRDLDLRGPGDYFGTKQSGVPEFKLGDLSKDYELLEAAREDTAELLQREGFWENGSFARLHELIQQDPMFTGDLLD